MKILRGLKFVPILNQKLKSNKLHDFIANILIINALQFIIYNSSFLVVCVVFFFFVCMMQRMVSNCIVFNVLVAH